MQKAFIIFIFFLLSDNLAHANILDWGPRWGTCALHHQDNSGINKAKSENFLVRSNKNYHIGTFARFNLLLFYIQPELLYTVTNIRFRHRNKIVTFQNTSVSVPVMVGCYFFRAIRVQIGPVFNFLLNTQNNGYKIRRYHWSPIVVYQAGLGVDIWRVFIDFKYEMNLSRQEYRIDGIHTYNRYPFWVLSIGFNIF